MVVEMVVGQDPVCAVSAASEPPLLAARAGRHLSSVSHDGVILGGDEVVHPTARSKVLLTWRITSVRSPMDTGQCRLWAGG
jgi:hypothetical protein